MYLLRDLGQEVRRFGSTRGIGFNGDRLSSGYYAVSRASLSMDASRAVYTTNNGIPDTFFVVMATTGVDNGIGMTSNKFDSTHSVSPSVTSTTASLSYSTPDGGEAVIDVCTSLRWPDVPGSASPDPSCQTKSSSDVATFDGLSAETTYYYRIVASGKWVAWGSFKTSSSN